MSSLESKAVLNSLDNEEISENKSNTKSFWDKETVDLLLQKFYFGIDKMLIYGSYLNLHSNCSLDKFEHDDNFSFPLEPNLYKKNLKLGINPHLLVEEKDIHINKPFFHVWIVINGMTSRFLADLNVQELLKCWIYFNYFYVDVNPVLSNWFGILVSKLSSDTTIYSSEIKIDIYNQFKSIVQNINKSIFNNENFIACIAIFEQLVGKEKSTIARLLLNKKVGYRNEITPDGTLLTFQAEEYKPNQLIYEKLHLCSSNYISLAKLIYQSEQPEILESDDFKVTMSKQLELSISQLEFVNLHIVSKSLLNNKEVKNNNNPIFPDLTFPVSGWKETKEEKTHLSISNNISIKEYLDLRAKSTNNKSPIIVTRRILLFEHLIASARVNVNIISNGFAVNRNRDVFFKSDVGISAPTLIELLIFLHIYYPDIFNNISSDKYRLLVIRGSNNLGSKFRDLKILTDKITEAKSSDPNVILNHCFYQLNTENLSHSISQLKEKYPNTVISLDISLLDENGNGIILIPDLSFLYPIMRKINLTPNSGNINICSTRQDKLKLFDSLTRTKIIEEKHSLWNLLCKSWT